MKHLFLSFSFLAILLMAQSCSPKYSAHKLSEKQIHWGNGGGFVGKESSHILCDNGQLFSQDILGNITAAGKTKTKKAKVLFKTIESLGLAKLELNQPGNTYSFLEFKEGDMVSRAVWGDKNSPGSKAVEDLFRQLNELLKK